MCVSVCWPPLSPSMSISDASAVCVSPQGHRHFLDIIRSSNGGQVSSPTLIICLLSIRWVEGGERKRGRWWYMVEFHADERMPCLREFGEMELPLLFFKRPGCASSSYLKRIRRRASCLSVHSVR